MADFPSSVKNFLTLQDGVDTVVAAHPNDRGNEITAIETLVGALGSSQAYSDSMKNLLSQFRRGCNLAYKTASDIYVRAGELTIKDSSNNVRYRRNPSDTTVNWANIDTGGEASGTTYYVYAVADASGTTFSVVISTNSSAPTGYTFYVRLGYFYNDGSSNITQGGIVNDSFAPGLGDWASKSLSTIYQAATDGFIVGSVNGEDDYVFYLYTDSNSSPSTARARFGWGSSTTHCYIAFCCPIKKGDYYQIVRTGSGDQGDLDYYYFIPIGA